MKTLLLLSLLLVSFIPFQSQTNPVAADRDQL